MCFALTMYNITAFEDRIFSKFAAYTKPKVKDEIRILIKAVNQIHLDLMPIPKSDCIDILHTHRNRKITMETSALFLFIYIINPIPHKTV